MYCLLIGPNVKSGSQEVVCNLCLCCTSISWSMNTNQGSVSKKKKHSIWIEANYSFTKSPLIHSHSISIMFFLPCLIWHRDDRIFYELVFNVNRCVSKWIDLFFWHKMILTRTRLTHINKWYFILYNFIF